MQQRRLHVGADRIGRHRLRTGTASSEGNAVAMDANDLLKLLALTACAGPRAQKARVMLLHALASVIHCAAACLHRQHAHNTVAMATSDPLQRAGSTGQRDAAAKR